MRKLIVSTFLTLDGVVQAPGGPGEDDSGGFTELRRHRCLETILNEEWEHWLYAERDLDVLRSRSS